MSLSLSLSHTLHIFSHADEKVVSTQIRHDKTHEYGTDHNNETNPLTRTFFTTGDLQLRSTNMQPDCHHPQTPKKQNKTHKHKKKQHKHKAKRQQVQASIIHTPEETTGRRPWNH